MLCRVTAGWIICYRRESIFPEYPRLVVVPCPLRWVSLARDVKAPLLAVTELYQTRLQCSRSAGDGICWGCQLFDTGWEKEASQINVCTQRRLTSFFHPDRCSFLLWFTAASGNTNTDIPEMSAVYEAACLAWRIPGSSSIIWKILFCFFFPLGEKFNFYISGSRRTKSH